jgi:hypothetical protein
MPRLGAFVLSDYFAVIYVLVYKPAQPEKSHRSVDEIMNVELNLEELELIVEALDQKHDALSSGRVIFKKPCVLQNRPAAYLL